VVRVRACPWLFTAGPCPNTFLLLLCQSIGWPRTDTVSEARRVRTCAPLARARPMAATNKEERMGSLRRAAEAEQRDPAKGHCWANKRKCVCKRQFDNQTVFFFFSFCAQAGKNQGACMFC